MESRTRRTVADYTVAFKLAVVDQIERGEMTYKAAQKLYGIQGASTVLGWLRLAWNLCTPVRVWASKRLVMTSECRPSWCSRLWRTRTFHPVSPKRRDVKDVRSLVVEAAAPAGLAIDS